MNTRAFSTFSSLLFCLASLSLSLPGSATAQALCDRPLIAGWESWEPFQFLDDGALKGYDIEVISAVAKDMGCEVTFRELPWARHLEELKKGEIDIAAGATKTVEREAFGRFSSAYRQDEVRLFVRAGEAATHTFTDLAGLAASDFRLGVSRSYVYGPIYGDLLEKNAFREDNLVQVDSEPQLFAMLARKRIDGFLAERSFFTIQTRNQGFAGQFEAHPIPVSTDSAFILFSKESVSDEWLAAFNQSLEKLRENGTLEAIEAKYLR